MWVVQLVRRSCGERRAQECKNGPCCCCCGVFAFGSLRLSLCLGLHEVGEEGLLLLLLLLLLQQELRVRRVQRGS